MEERIGERFWKDDYFQDHGILAIETSLKDDEVTATEFVLITETGEKIPVDVDRIIPVSVCLICGEEIREQPQDTWFVTPFNESGLDEYYMNLEDLAGEVCIYCQESAHEHGTWLQIYHNNQVYEAKYTSDGLLIDKGAINVMIDEMPLPVGEDELDWSSLDEEAILWIEALYAGETTSRKDSWRAHYYSKPDEEILISLDIVDIRFDDTGMRDVHNRIIKKFVDNEIPLIFVIHRTYNILWSQGEYFSPVNHVEKATELIEEFKAELNRGGWR